MRYSAAYNKISVVGDGQGVRASIQVDSNPFISTSICGQGICQFDEGKSAELLQQLRTGSQIQIQLQLQDTMAGPFMQSLKGFERELQRAIQAQRAR
jgi:invasion protein IalB